MKLDGATIPIEPRGFGENFDLAGRLYVTDFRQIAQLGIVFLIPTLVFGWFACEYTSDGMMLSFAWFFLVSPLFGGAIVAGEGPRAFGEPFFVRSAWASFGANVGRMLRSLVPIRLGLVVAGAFLWQSAPPLFVLWLVVMVLVAHTSSHVRELILLERLAGARLRRRLADLRQSPQGPGKALRYAQTAFVCGLIGLLVFGLADLVCDWLLGIPLIHLSDVEAQDALPMLAARMRNDPRAVLGVQTVLWLVYPLGRLTLFLDYLDVRIRKECWDVELDFRIEAARLEAFR